MTMRVRRIVWKRGPAPMCSEQLAAKRLIESQGGWFHQGVHFVRVGPGGALIKACAVWRVYWP